MARRRYNNYEPQIVDPGVIDFGAIQMYNPEDTARLAQVGQNMQQRWDASQSMFAKYLEDIGAADLSALPEDVKSGVMQRLSESPEKLHATIQKNYQGDYGKAFNEVMQVLSKDRALMHQGIQESKKLAQARAEYQQQLARGQAPQKYVPGQGMVTMSFEDYHENRMPGFNEEGKFVGGQYNALRGASNLSGYLKENVSAALNAQSIEGGLNPSKNALGFLVQQTKNGMSDPEIYNLLFDKNNNLTPYGEQLTSQLKGEVTFLQDEFKGQSDKEIIKYATPIIQGQVAEGLKYDYKQDPTMKGGKPKKPKKPIISGASVYADISANPFIEEKGTTYVESLNDFQTPWFAEFLGAKRKYDNAEDLLNKYNERLVEVTKKVAEQTKNNNLKSELEEALNAGSNAMIGAMAGKIIASYGTAGMGGLAILPLTLKGDTRSLNENDVIAITSAYNGLQLVNEDIKTAKENLINQGIDISKMNDREIAEYLDKDYTLRSKTQDVLYLTTYQGAKALSNMYNENPLGKLSGGFRTAESSDMLPLDVLAKKTNIDVNQLEEQIMDSKQWNYNLDTGEFGMKLNTAEKGKDPKHKTFYFTLDNATTQISNGLKEINVLESNPSKKRSFDQQIKEKGKGISISKFPGVYDIQYVGGDDPYSIIYLDYETGEQSVAENLNSTQLKLFIKNRIVNPYLQYTYGED